MIKYLTKHGNSLAIVLDKPILELMGAGAETPLELRMDGCELTIRPAIAEDRKEALAEALRVTNKQFGEDLKRLAE